MKDLDVTYCFYDELADRERDADAESLTLRAWHRVLWSKQIPGTATRLEWQYEAGTMNLECAVSGRSIRVSSDTIATTHARYVKDRFPGVTADSLVDTEDAFYTIGGFLVFPVHQGSINQKRGWAEEIKDRFDLTLECIRRHYLGDPDHPLADVLAEDAAFFALFGNGLSGFATYVDFFHLDHLVNGDSMRWFDGHVGRWDFSRPPLPATEEAYKKYLVNVGAFVAERNKKIEAWAVVSGAPRS